MDYKVLIDKFFSATTSLEEEEELRRYLKGENIPIEVLEEKELLLSMLEPVEYDCSEAMAEITEMVDGFAVKENASVEPPKIMLRVLSRFVFQSIVAAAVAFFACLHFLYSNNSIEQMDNSSVVVSTEKQQSQALNDVQPIVAEYETVNTIVPVNPTIQDKTVSLHVASEEKNIANTTKDDYVRVVVSEQPAYVGALHTDGTKTVGYKNFSLRGAVSGNALYEPQVMYSGAYLNMSEISVDMGYVEYLRGNDCVEYIANELSATPFSLQIEFLFFMEYDQKEIAEGQILSGDSLKFALDDVHWNPAFPLQVYDMHDEGNETIVTFLVSVCTNSQYIVFSKGIYAEDNKSGDVYNVIGYSDGLTMERLLVVNDCIGKNVLISLRFPKFKRKVKSVTIHNPGHTDDIRTINNREISLMVLAENVDVKEMRRRYKLRRGDK